MRRYNCTYRSSGFLYPPHELLRAATVIKKYSSKEVLFIDAVAENLSFEEVEDRIEDTPIEGFIYLAGLENVSEEREKILRLKKRFPGIKAAAIGFYPSKFREEFTYLDAALDGAFEERIRDALSKDGSFFQNLKNGENSVFEIEPDILDSVARSFLKEDRYRDLFIKGKTAWLFTAFGCPYNCSFCIRTYDSKKWLPRNSDKVIQELKELIESGYKNFRFLDDNITLNRPFLKKLKVLYKDLEMKPNLYGFSRADLIDKELADLLKELNFKRIYIGVETFSSVKQSEYRKQLDTSYKLKTAFNELSRVGIETAVWIIYDPDTDRLSSLPRAAWRLSRLGVSMVLMNILIPYRGTELYENRYGDKEFSEFAIRLAGPLKCGLASILFYASYALHFLNWKSLISYLVRFPGSFLRSALYNYANSAGVFYIPGRRQVKK